MAVKRKEYLLTVDKFKEPAKVEGNDAVAVLLLRLMLMEPYTDPLHPDMGVGIITYRYSMDNKDDLRKRIESQIHTYLPYFSEASVVLIYCPDHTLNVEITIDGVTFVYDSSKSPKPIRLIDISSN